MEFFIIIGEVAFLLWISHRLEQKILKAYALCLFISWPLVDQKRIMFLLFNDLLKLAFHALQCFIFHFSFQVNVKLKAQ